MAGATSDQPPDNDALYFVTSADELNDGEKIIIDIEEIEVIVFNVQGEYFAMLNYCPHQGGPLGNGRVSGMLTETSDRRLSYSHENQIISCPWHGWEFDIKTGRHTARPKYGVPTLDVLERDNNLFVALPQ